MKKVLLILFVLSLLSAQGMAAAIGDWPMDEGSGTLVRDRSANKNNGTVEGGSWDASALAFDGADDRVVVKTQNGIPALTAATWSVWVKQDAYVNGAGVLGKYQALAGKRSFLVRTALNSSVTVILSSDGTAAQSHTSTSNKQCGIRANNEWTLLTIVYTGEKIQYYRNGVLCDEDSTSMTRVHNAAPPLIFSGANNVFFRGKMRDVRFFDAALSAGEVADLFGSNETAPPIVPEPIASGDPVAVGLDGTDDGVRVATSNGMSALSKATWNMWVRQKEYQDLAGLVGKYETAGKRSFLIRTALQQSVSVILSENGVQYEADTSTSNRQCGIRNNNEWTMITVVYDGAKIQYYRNGVLCDEDSTGVGKIFGSDAALRMGDANNRAFAGLIDDYKIYGSALSASQVRRLFDESEYGGKKGMSVPVLLYHQIADTADARDKVAVAEFEQQMQYLAQEGFTPITIEDYNRWKQGLFTMPEKPVVISMDDGWKSIYTKAMPIMDKYNMKGTNFVVLNYAGGVEGSPSYMSWDEINALKAKGWGVEAHGIRHVDMRTLSEEDFRKQLSESKKVIAEETSVTPKSFVFPFHGANQEYTAICGEYYDLCWTRGSEMDNPSYVFRGTDGDTYDALRRITVASYTTLSTFKSALGRATDMVGEWLMNEGSGDVAADTSGLNNDAKLENGALWIGG